MTRPSTILEDILREEVAHVAAGSRWFAWCCEREGVDAQATFEALVARHLRGALRGPFNAEARLRAGFTLGRARAPGRTRRMRRIAFALAVLASWTILVLVAARVDMVVAVRRRPSSASFRGNDFTRRVRHRERRCGCAARRIAPAPTTRACSRCIRPISTRTDSRRCVIASRIFRARSSSRWCSARPRSPTTSRSRCRGPAMRVRTFDLSRVPEWHGRIVEIGFARVSDRAARAAGARLQAVRDRRGGALVALVARRSRRARDRLVRRVAVDAALGACARPRYRHAARACRSCSASRSRRHRDRVDRRFCSGGAIAGSRSAAAIALAIAWLALDVAWQVGTVGTPADDARGLRGSVRGAEREHTVADTDIADAADEAARDAAQRADRPRASSSTPTRPAATSCCVSSGTCCRATSALYRATRHSVRRRVAGGLPDRFLPHRRVAHEPMHGGRCSRTASTSRRRRRFTRDGFEDEPVVVFRFRHGR